MSNPREKNVVDDEQYHSQPTKNSLSWVPNKWRRLSLKHPASSSSVPKTTMNDVTKDVMDEAAKVPVEDAQDKNESHTLSRDFHSEMYDYRTKYGSEYANGMNELYSPFWEVQYIYIPIYVQAIEDWLLVQINLCTMELTQYWCNHKYSKHYGRLIHNGVLQKFDMFFDKLLDAVSYWRRVIHGPYKPQEKGYLKTRLINDDYLPKIGGGLGWLDPPMCPRATVIIPGLLRSKNKLEDEVKELKATIGKNNFIIFFLIVLVALMFLY
ncbi:hypothetical protein R6Q57_019390 [Mikania cordata]